MLRLWARDVARSFRIESTALHMTTRMMTRSRPGSCRKGRPRKRFQLPLGPLGRWAYTRSKAVHSLVQSGIRSAWTVSSGGETHYAFFRGERMASFPHCSTDHRRRLPQPCGPCVRDRENQFACARIRAQAHRIPCKVNGKGVVCDQAGPRFPDISVIRQSAYCQYLLIGVYFTFARFSV